MQTVAIEKLRDLHRLASSREDIHISAINEALHADLKNSLIGKTFRMLGNDILIHPSDFRDWLHKLNTSGFDYALQLKDERKEAIARY
ncbi:MAG TPA: hypothetical protein VIN08_07660 [Ohtaekwangia sp.]|uniref:hypothetical protein n=1 Tax=Ohtaekwangia sp. TaxID=2066019 RepID=UPI002F95C11B